MTIVKSYGRSRMKPSAEQTVMLENVRDTVYLPGNFRGMASDLLKSYDPIKHAELDQSLKGWEGSNSQ